MRRGPRDPDPPVDRRGQGRGSGSLGRRRRNGHRGDSLRRPLAAVRASVEGEDRVMIGPIVVETSIDEPGRQRLDESPSRGRSAAVPRFRTTRTPEAWSGKVQESDDLAAPGVGPEADHVGQDRDRPGRRGRPRDGLAPDREDRVADRLAGLDAPVLGLGFERPRRRSPRRSAGWGRPDACGRPGTEAGRGRRAGAGSSGAGPGRRRTRRPGSKAGRAGSGGALRGHRRGRRRWPGPSRRGPGRRPGLRPRSPVLGSRTTGPSGALGRPRRWRPRIRPSRRGTSRPQARTAALAATRWRRALADSKARRAASASAMWRRIVSIPLRAPAWFGAYCWTRSEVLQRGRVVAGSVGDLRGLEVADQGLEVLEREAADASGLVNPSDPLAGRAGPLERPPAVAALGPSGRRGDFGELGHARAGPAPEVARRVDRVVEDQGGRAVPGDAEGPAPSGDQDLGPLDGDPPPTRLVDQRGAGAVVELGQPPDREGDRLAKPLLGLEGEGPVVAGPRGSASRGATGRARRPRARRSSRR